MLNIVNLLYKQLTLANLLMEENILYQNKEMPPLSGSNWATGLA